MSTDVILRKFPFACAILNAIAVMLRPSLDTTQVFELIPLRDFIPVEKDVDLWTLTVSTDDHYFCHFAVQF